MNQLEIHELKELLIKCWITHDGLWFANCLQQLGIEKANALNLASIKSLSAIEVPRITKALGMEKGEIKTFEKFKEGFEALFRVVKGDFMRFNYSFPADNLMAWEMERCFAYEGMKRLGVIDQYRCGVLYRIQCWFDVLGLECRFDPPVGSCLIPKTGKCSGEIRFFF
ncbi:MAG: hypothetical protein HY879_23500 [Deltaproteobacteria bacterium]|nr:hypothetical protein [Deltaproteobacteria bacterium]